MGSSLRNNSTAGSSGQEVAIKTIMAFWSSEFNDGLSYIDVGYPSYLSQRMNFLTKPNWWETEGFYPLDCSWKLKGSLINEDVPCTSYGVLKHGCAL